MLVPDSIAPFIGSQLPAFYHQEGPQFVAFLEAYYEWLGETQDRQILANRDIDLAADSFLENFKRTYLPNITFDSVTNKRLLVKNAIDIYRSKGTSRGINLFMRLVYGVGADVIYPGDNVLRPSDSQWFQPRFIEVSKSPYTRSLHNKVVTGSQSGATAFVDSVVEHRTPTDTIDVLYITDILGTFITGETLSSGTIYDASPRITGSVIRATISDGGANFIKYQDLTFKGVRGAYGRARVTSISSTGAITSVKILDSGIGFKNGEIAYLQYGPGLTGASMTVEVGALGHLEGHQEGPGVGTAHIHDSDYYQEFSYEVLTSLPLDKYVTALKDVLHTAGRKMFGAVVMNSTVIVSAPVATTSIAIS